MHEIEIKFQVPAAQRAAVDAAVAGRARPARLRLQAAYHDTAERTLATAGLALRLRREGRQWVQTLKGATDDSMTRLEHNVPRGRAAVMPPIAPQLHAGTPVGEALLALLAGRNAPALAVVYRTDILRRARGLRTPQGRVELAFDAGSIHAGDRKTGVRELEIELLGGSPLAVLDTARRWLARFGLWLDVRSKAERGDLLARGVSIAPPRLASAVRLTPQMTAAQAWQAVLRSCTDQITANASQIASGEHGDEHVHQLRVGLRRLRSALRLFDGLGAEQALAEPAAVLFRRLGSARDQVVIEGEFAAGLLAAMRTAGVAGDAPVATPGAADAAPAEVLRERASQTLLLDLLAACHVPGADERESESEHEGEGEGSAVADPSVTVHDPKLEPAMALRERLAQRLNRWHREVVADTKRFADLDDTGRHRLRKRAKRLRYAAEFCAALFERRALRRYLRRLRALQERLGALGDVVMAMQAFAPDRDQDRDGDPRAMFALGWLAGRREQLIAQAAPQLRAFGKVERYWKRS